MAGALLAPLALALFFHLLRDSDQPARHGFYFGLARARFAIAYIVGNTSFEEDRLGRLSVGMLADITVLSRDIMSVPEDQIPGTEVLYTIVGGRVLYRNPRERPVSR